jgi:hypothetical protein
MLFMLCTIIKEPFYYSQRSSVRVVCSRAKNHFLLRHVVYLVMNIKLNLNFSAPLACKLQVQGST